MKYKIISAILALALTITVIIHRCDSLSYYTIEKPLKGELHEDNGHSYILFNDGQWGIHNPKCTQCN